MRLLGIRTYSPRIFRDGRTLSWVSELRYLGIFIVKSRNFKCSLSNAKCNFNRAVNGIFSKILNFASEEVILELITMKIYAHSLIRPRIVSTK